MPEHFCISVTFHDPRFHGQGEGGEPEWPPSPLRLYQAIVAACAARGALDQARAALLWLERQPEPTIVAPEVLHSLPYRIAVPNNDLDVPARYWSKGQDAPKYKNPQDLKSMKTVQAVQFQDGDTLHYLYSPANSLPGEAAAHLRFLTTIVPSITHLGWGVDMVAARGQVIDAEEATKLRGQRWTPVHHAATHLRVPRAGMLNALIDRHEAFLSRISEAGYSPVAPLEGFRRVPYDDAERINCRPYAAFDLAPVDPEDRRPRKSFSQRDTVRVAAMLRHTACNAAKNDLADWRDKEWAERFVAGHGPHESAESFPRFSYLPLPSVGGPHADGLIRRVLVAETSGGDGKSAAWAQQRLDNLTLCDEQNGRDEASLRAVTGPLDGVFKAYVSSADRWQTVTPVILPGFDDNDRGKRLRLLLRCFDQVGIPRELIADVDVQKSPWVGASVQPRAFDGRRSRRLEGLPACHVRVYFKRPIAGPVALGAGRHRGLGLFAVCN